MPFSQKRLKCDRHDVMQSSPKRTRIESNLGIPETENIDKDIEVHYEMPYIHGATECYSEMQSSLDEN